MKTFVRILVLSAVPIAGFAQAPAGDSGVSLSGMRSFMDQLRSQSTSSRSGQFTVIARTPPAAVLPPALTKDSRLIALDPRLLTVSCERIKQSLYQVLGAGDSWRGKITLYLRPARTADDATTLVAERFPGGWMYRLELPDVMEQGRYVRTIVDVLLLEMANRGAGSRSAEIPAWLAEGVAQEVLARDGVQFLLHPPGATENGLNINRVTLDLTDGRLPSAVARKLNPLAEVQQTLRVHAPLTFDQLSWPTAELLSGEAGETYRCSAQLFVNQLLVLRNGPACLCAMLDDLPRRLNWQLAFLNGFRDHFRSALDVEKWWALQVVHFSGRDLMQTWTPEESWKKLDQILRTQVEVRSSRQELPLRTEVTLQKIIREWDLLRQSQQLMKQLHELNLLRSRVAQDLVQLVDDYRAVLGAYLEKRGVTPGHMIPGRNSAGPLMDRLAEDTIRQLDELDARRETLRPGSPAPIAATVTTGNPAPGR